MPHRVLLEHAVEDEHVFLYRREEVRFLPREVLLRVNHVVIDESQHIVVHRLPVLLHVLPYLRHYRLQPLLHLVRRVLSPIMLQLL